MRAGKHEQKYVVLNAARFLLIYSLIACWQIMALFPRCQSRNLNTIGVGEKKFRTETGVTFKNLFPVPRWTHLVQFAFFHAIDWTGVDDKNTEQLNKNML